MWLSQTDQNQTIFQRCSPYPPQTSLLCLCCQLKKSSKSRHTEKRARKLASIPRFHKGWLADESTPRFQLQAGMELIRPLLPPCFRLMIRPEYALNPKDCESGRNMKFRWKIHARIDLNWFFPKEPLFVLLTFE